ncbi:roquin-2-like [Ctenocephalides felis]|uniref:roquin-2-like n=1 Tax=Ctenocephalides felis TaxID=7515 RepID=UPI000E6E26C7|nr:roquin-2-like [Ctenocephalides felis]
MPIQAPQWTDFLCCPVCCHEFAANHRAPISLGCGHTICKTCLANLHRKQCPFDQTVIVTDINSLPVNSALLQLISPSTVPVDCDNSEVLKCLSPEDLKYYLQAMKCIEELALYLRPFHNGSTSILSRPMQRKLVTLVNCQLIEDEGRSRSMRAARSLGERTVTELILQHQNPQQLSANLWAGVRARGCQFLGPAMQEEVLKLVLLALEDGSALSRKVLVMFVVQRLEPHFPQASKTSIGHVVQLLYRASCFKVSKREGDSSLMQLKEEFRTYDALRREHDAQIVQIATEAGLRVAPDQWSALLYGDAAHRSHMQSVMDKLQGPQSFALGVQELVIALQRSGDPADLGGLTKSLELLAGIDANAESVVPTWQQCSAALTAVARVVFGLVDFIMHHSHGNSNNNLGNTNVSGMCRSGNIVCKQSEQMSQHFNVGAAAPQPITINGANGVNSKYKVSMCRDLTLKNSCPRGVNCTFAHSEDELDRHRAKSRKSLRPTGNNKTITDENFKQNYQAMSPINMVPTHNMPAPMPLPLRIPNEHLHYNTGYNMSTARPVLPVLGDHRFSNTHDGFATSQGIVLSPNKPNMEYYTPNRMDSARMQNWDSSYYQVVKLCMQIIS